MAVSNMALPANKTVGGSRNRLNILERKFLARIKKEQHTKTGVVKFPHVFSVASWLFRLNKRETWLLLRELEEKGVIELIMGHGVRILVEVDGNDSD